MAYGNGVNWNGSVGTSSSTVYFEVEFTGSPTRYGILRLELDPGKPTASDVAEQLAKKWNAETPVAGTYAFASGDLIAFFSKTGGLKVSGMGVWPPTGARRPLKDRGAAVEVIPGKPGLKVKNVQTKLEIAP